MKVSTSVWIKEIFPDFSNWQDGYGAFTISWEARDSVIEYIKQQPEHHKRFDFREEYIALLKKFGVHNREDYLE